MPRLSANNKNDNIVYSIKTIQVFTFNMGNNNKNKNTAHTKKRRPFFLLQILQLYKYNNEPEEWKRDIIFVYLWTIFIVVEFI